MQSNTLPDGHWFKAANVGMFIHWDHASQVGYEIGWPLVGGLPHLPSPVPDSAAGYHASAATFDPVDWDPERLVAAAKRIRAQYAVFTTRHHSGWSSWPTKAADFSIASSPFGQRGGDLVRDFTDAFRRAGIKVGLYYSLSDWHHPDYLAFTDDQRPYNHRPRMGTPEQWQRYRAYVKAQLTELLTQYGKIDLLWFDGDWERTEAEWESADIVSHVRALQPDIVLNNRLAGHGDYVTPEQYIPAVAPEGAWECGVTMNRTWGYVPTDTAFKTPYELVRTLIQVRAGGGNMLLNIGPTGTGAIAPAEMERLEAIGSWLDIFGESVLGTERGLEPWRFFGPTTVRDDTIYCHLLAWPTESFSLRDIPVRRVRSVRLLHSGEVLNHRYQISPLDDPKPDPIGELIIEVPRVRPDVTVPVVAITVENFAREANGAAARF